MRPALEVADIFHRHGPAYRQAHADHLGGTERRVMAAIEACRTPVLGGHVEHCADCGLVRCAYNSCLMGKFSNGESAVAPGEIPAVFERYGAASHFHLVPINPDLPGATVDLAASGQ